MREALGWLAELVSGRAFLLGRSLTIADVAVYAQLAWMRNYAQGALVAEQSAVVEWMAHLDEIPAVRDGLG
jgi:glutathione S-transferase